MRSGRKSYYASPAVLEVIELSYMLLLMSKLIPFVGSNRMSAMPNAEFGNELECGTAFV